MDKKLFTTYIRYFVIITLLFTGLANAQVKPSDSTKIIPRFSVPSPVRYEAYYEVKSNKYYLYPKVGNLVVGAPIALTPQEYSRYILSNKLKDYYQEKSNKDLSAYRKDDEKRKNKNLIPSINIRNKIFETIFGGNKIELIPQGFASFDLGILRQKIDNPLILPQNRTSFAINIQQRIQLGMTGKIGENLILKANYDTQSGFAFENKLNVAWQSKGSWQDLQTKGLGALGKGLDGGEDKIIKKIEFGNVNMPLSSGLIRGSQSLFGIKADFKLAKTTGTVVLSQQQGESRQIVVQGGGAITTFKVNALDYEDNQHYYLGRYFFNNYDTALENYPLINSKINITRLEVWVIDQGASNLQEQKSVVGIRDLGDGSSLPDNTNLPGASATSVYQSILNIGPDIRNLNNVSAAIAGKSLPTFDGTSKPYIEGEFFALNRRARRLNTSEYYFNPQLGYISLNQRLNDNQFLAVSYSYLENGSNKIHKVGEFSEESPVIIAKLLKSNSRSANPDSPMWDLMMRNIYAMNANQIQKDNFLLNILYKDATNGKVNYLPNTSIQNKTLLKLFNWDRLNQNNDVQSNGTTTGDGLFDFVPNITIDPNLGKLIFTKAQPFGSYLAKTLGSNDPNFVFTDLYTKLKVDAAQSSLAQRYTMEGKYKGSTSSGISLGALNVPQGSVKVTANGVALVEGQDYTVDYMLGTVTIINEALKNSGQAINVSLENQLTFNTQRKRFLGLNLEHKFNEHFMLGATAVNYSEVPLTQKVQMGSEAVNNTMVGLNMNYNNELPFLTRLTDKIPFINTEAPSKLNFKAEGAYLIPGQNKGINDQSYIDDFEQTTSKINLKEPSSWSIASRPELSTTDPVFGTIPPNDNTQYGNGRGLLSWYYIDPRFYGVGGKAPGGINAAALSNFTSRRIQTSELFNNIDLAAGDQTFINSFDVTFYPKEKGPYNLNPNAETTQQRWGGLMRSISVSNFNTSNISYVEFWMQDPYADGGTLGANPRLLFQLGNVSEDVLKDGRLQYENGLPTNSVPAKTQTSNWGTQPVQAPVLYAYSSDGADRTMQDVGFDGLGDGDELTKFGITNINPVLKVNDPASDDFVFPLSDKFQGAQASSVQERYKYFRNPDGNSQANTLEVSTQTPDAEDLNRDFNLDTTENYFQYNISLNKADLVVGQNKIVDSKVVNVKLQNGQSADVKWYLFRIPVTSPDAGNVNDKTILNNVRYMRMLMAGFDNTSTLRFGTLDLTRADWRTYTKNFSDANDPDGTKEGTMDKEDKNFSVGSVNLEENSRGAPPYMMPPGITRQVLSGNAGVQRQNEASLALTAKALKGEARGVFKNTNLDMRRFKTLGLFVHAQDLKETVKGNTLDQYSKFFIRLGSDASDNYYEYEMSLKFTDKNATSIMDIWPSDNEINLEVQNFVDAKLRRDQARKSNNAILLQRFTDNGFGDSNKKIYIKGQPSLGNITTIVLGVRNATDNTSMRVAAEARDYYLWIDELRLMGIDNKGGYAANASLNFNLGDFAVVNAVGSYSTVGFGAIDQRPEERSQSTKSLVGVNTTVNVDKFLPEKAGMRIPVNYSYTQTTEDPKYNPLNTDVEFNKDPNKDQLKKIARTYTQQRSIGVVNMHKERTTNKKPKFYDVENISATILYNDDYYRDIYTTKNYRQYLRAYFDYNFSFKPYVIKPFNKLISDTAKSTKYLRWIKEFNFNPIPTRFSFRTDIDRNYSELQFRDVNALLTGLESTNFEAIRNRNFYFGWQYNLGFNFSKSLKMDIFANTRTLNDNISPDAMNNNSIFGNPFRYGRPVMYSHKVQLNYHVPFEYFPYLDFINAELGYGFLYTWNARSTAFTQSSVGNLGNIAQNTNDKIATATVDFPKFFSKFKYFKKIDEIQQKRRREIDSLNNVYTQQANNPKKKFTFKSYRYKNRLSPTQAIMSIFNSIKTANISFNENNGTILPGIVSTPNFYGYGQNIGGPTLGFLLGSQADIRRIAMENPWLTNESALNDPYSQMKTQSITGKIQMQPIQDLRIDFDFLRNYNKTLNQTGFNLKTKDPITGDWIYSFQNTYQNELITYSYSTITLKTAFTSGDQIYNKIVDNARTISQRMGGALDNNGFTVGNSITNPYVLVPAFQAAVKGAEPTSVGNPTKAKFPIPNWRLVYSGLRNVPFINSKFAKFDLLHSYRSTFTATGIQSNPDYDASNPAKRYIIGTTSVNGATVNIEGDYVTPYIYSQVGYVEEFGPIAGFDATMRNNMQFKFMYNRSRMLLLGLVNKTLTQNEEKEYIFGFGYIMKNLKLKLRFRGKEQELKSDLNLRADISLKDNVTRITTIDSNTGGLTQITGGQKLLGIKVSADYNVSKNFNLKFFYDQLTSKYKISTAYPLSTIRAGLTATFTFAGNSGY